MFNSAIWLFISAAGVIGLVMLGTRLVLRLREQRLQQAKQQFSLRREWIEAEFVKLAGIRGIPRGLQWVDCEFDDAVQFARDRASGQLRALVAMTIRFQAVEGGGMEDVEAVGNLRAATGVFFYERNKWTTAGRALFNLNPSEAIQHYRHELETVDE